MGLKLLDLSLCTLIGRKVKLHTTGEEASVSVVYGDKAMTFFLHFDNDRKEEVKWSADLQGFSVAGDELDGIEQPLLAAP